MQPSKPILLFLAGILFGLASPSLGAEVKRIAVPDFELNDLAGMTPTPPAEMERTASVAPMLRNALSLTGTSAVVAIDPQSVNHANQGFGYLFDHADEAARLGDRFGADWVVVSRVHKPSFLFAYLKVHLVNVKNARLVGDYVVEVKGEAKQATARGVTRLAEQLEQTLNADPAR
jgi:hypothetical protein